MFLQEDRKNPTNCYSIEINGRNESECWQIFNRQRMLVIDGKYNNEDGMSTESM
jgi:hypothetical protein